MSQTHLRGLQCLTDSESCSVVSNSFCLHGLYSAGNFPGQNTEVGSCFLLQGIFSTRGSNRGLLHCRQILYHLSHKEAWEFRRQAQISNRKPHITATLKQWPLILLQPWTLACCPFSQGCKWFSLVTLVCCCVLFNCTKTWVMEWVMKFGGRKP